MAITITEAQEHILEFLQQNGGVGVLATADKSGDPHAATVYLMHDDNFNVYFLTKDQTRKSQNLADNPQAAIAIFEPNSQTTVQIKGKVSEVEDVKVKNDIFENILKNSMATSESGMPPISKLNAGGYIAYQLTPSSVRMASFIRPDPGSYEQIFEIA